MRLRSEKEFTAFSLIYVYQSIGSVPYTQTRRRMLKLLLFSVVAFLIFEKSTSQISKFDATDPCNAFTSCRDCIRSDKACSWCTSYPPSSTDPRCFSYNDTMCEDREDPEGTIEIVDNMEEEGLLKPQRVNLRLRVGEPQSFDFTVRPLRGYPVDLYFLIDYSKSLEPFITTLKNTTRQLADSLANFTSHYTVGLGAFVDKPVKPFINAHPNFTNTPCAGCTRTFSFVNLLNLTNDTTRLQDALSAIQVSGNLDGPESLLDGLMQSVVCQQVIGWRDQARHLILSVSDDIFKFAGHGKYAGIMKRSDGKCHLDENNEFSLAGEFDYPSMSHLAAILTQYQAVPILGYTASSQSGVQDYYARLAEALPRGIGVDLSQGASALISKFEETYKALSGEVAVQADTFSDLEIKVKLVHCPGEQFGDTCLLSDSNAMVNYTATVTVLKCTEELKQGREVAIRAVFFGGMTVFVQAICECSCEQEISNATSAECSGSGSVVCGQCRCDDDRYGRTCECERSGNGTVGEAECPSPNGQVCSGKGTCSCGMCICQEGTYGDACQCSDTNCPVGTNQIQCSSRNFSCKCGVCECGPGYTGDDCSCSPDRDQCMTESGGMCNGQGHCECNRCECNDGYSGPVCEYCVDPEVCDPQCSSYSDCVDCYFDLTNDVVVMVENASETCSSVCQSATKPITVNLINGSSGSTGSSLNGTTCKRCSHSAQGTNCNDIRFFICLLPTRIVIQALQTPDSCSSPVEAWVIAVPIVIGLLILLVIILVAIKLILVLLDYLEYKKFLKNVKDSSPGNMINPLYTAPERQIDNPLYEAGSNEE